MKPFQKPGCDRYGASMGRRGYTSCTPSNLHLQRVPIDSQGYDQGGAYWGLGVPLYCAWNNGFEAYVRAESRKAAMALIKERHPQATFLRGASISKPSRPWSCTPYVGDCNLENRRNKSEG